MTRRPTLSEGASGAAASNDTTNDAELGELTIVREHDAPIDLVFDCMTTPEHLTHFWGPTGTTTPLDGIVIELRPGGRFETLMRSDDGSEFLMRAVYAEVDRPRTLVWTEPDVEGGMTTRVTFEAIGDTRTRVTTHQTNVPPMYRSAEARAGFETSLDRFDVYLSSLAGA
jgi:uncharacterized protein YndB with AHSA1/START domain